MRFRVLSLIALCMVAAPSFAADDAMKAERLEKMLTAGDTDWIVQTFRRYPDDVLPFIDQYLEGGLKIIEDGGDEAKALESYRRGLEFAKLANDAFGEVIFAQYAASFGSWSPQERMQFREGQKAVRAAREAKDDPATAVAHFERALKLAQPIGDSWGEAMAHMGLAQTQMTTGDYEASKGSAMKAAELNGRLRLRVAHIRARVACAQAHARMDNAAAGRGHMRIAWESLVESDDAKLRREVLDAYLVALDASGNQSLANELREQHGLQVDPES